MEIELANVLDVNALMNFSQLTNEQIVKLSFQMLGIAVIIIVIALIILFFATRKNKEEKIAGKMLKHVNKIRDGKVNEKSKPIVPEPNTRTTPQERPAEQSESSASGPANETAEEESHMIRPDELSLKDMLVNKFKPIIEKQLQTKIEVKDFSAKGENFLSHILVQGHELELTLDSSGKIIDYKRLDE